MADSPLAVYPKILAISQQMAALAKAENWDALVASEGERACSELLHAVADDYSTATDRSAFRKRIAPIKNQGAKDNHVPSDQPGGTPAAYLQGAIHRRIPGVRIIIV